MLAEPIAPATAGISAPLDDGLAGQIVLVTGAAGGIGAAVSRRMHAAGATVVAVDLASRPLTELASAEKGIVPHLADVADPNAATELISTVERQVGPVDVCVHVAGQLSAAPLVELTDRQWRQMFQTNVDGVFHVSRAVAPTMIRRRRGVIITVASNAAGVPRVALAGYAASKAAAVALTRCLGLELATYGIRCNTVCPGSTNTPMLRATGQDPATAIAGTPDQWRLGIPLGRIADPEDVADAVLFLASERARHITMQNLYVDGGASLAC